jgi:glucosamine kinase
LKQSVVIGIDGGGTYTRVAVADLEGNVLSHSIKGGSHPGKNQDPLSNVQQAIQEALHVAGCSTSSVSYVVGGFAGLNERSDLGWARELTNVPGLNCPKEHKNDAEVAQYGAFLGDKGIIGIAGTGSIVLGKTEEHTVIKNYDYHHDSKAGARYLSYSVIYQLITSTDKMHHQEDQLLANVLQFWDVTNMNELRILASKGYGDHNIAAIKKLSEMATIVTNAALNGSEMARNACFLVAAGLVTGLELVGSSFNEEAVPYTLVGGVATHPFIEKCIREQLMNNEFKQFIYQQPLVSPVLGAVLNAYDQLGIKEDKRTQRLLQNRMTGI